MTWIILWLLHYHKSFLSLQNKRKRTRHIWKSLQNDINTTGWTWERLSWIFPKNSIQKLSVMIGVLSSIHRVLGPNKYIIYAKFCCVFLKKNIIDNFPIHKMELRLPMRYSLANSSVTYQKLSGKYKTECTREIMQKMDNLMMI